MCYENLFKVDTCCALFWVLLYVLVLLLTVVCQQVIDEIYRVLRYVNSTRAPQRAHEVLQELRDISSMAMEYFDEKIVPILKKKLPGAELTGRIIGTVQGNNIFKDNIFKPEQLSAHRIRKHFTQLPL